MTDIQAIETSSQLADFLRAELRRQGLLTVFTNTGVDHLADRLAGPLADVLRSLAGRAAERTGSIAAKAAEAAMIAGVEMARDAFNRMWANSDWDGQVSLGFASCFDQELDQVIEQIGTDVQKEAE